MFAVVKLHVTIHVYKVARVLLQVAPCLNCLDIERLMSGRFIVILQVAPYAYHRLVMEGVAVMIPRAAAGAALDV